MANEPSAAQRKLFAKMGYAMPDGSFYIRPMPLGAGDLDNAIKAVGRGEQGGTSGASIRKHIMARAAALKLSSKIPDTWNSDGTLKETSAEQSAMTLADFFEHHGVKGQKWGVRKELATAGKTASKGLGKAAKTALDHPFLTYFGAIAASRIVGTVYAHRGEIAGTAYLAGKIGAYLVKQAFTKDSPVSQNIAIGRQVVQGFVVHGIDGVNVLIPEGPGPDINPPQLSDHDRLISAAQDHESVAASHMTAASKAAQDVTDLQQHGLNAPAAKKAFGKDVASQSDGAFLIKNSKTKSAAVAALSTKLSQSRGDHIQLATYHTNMAQKLKTKASKMAQDGFNFDPNFDVDVYLSHFGVKGMHWGERKVRGPASEDHVRVTDLRTKVKTGHGVHVLSNNELQDVNTRLSLETNYSRLVNGGETSTGEKFVDGLVGVGGSVAKQQASSYANKYAAKGIEKGIEHLITKVATKK